MEYLRTENAYLREMLILNGYQKNGRKKRFVAIEQLVARGYKVKLLCAIAEVSRSGYYRYVYTSKVPLKILCWPRRYNTSRKMSAIATAPNGWLGILA